MDAKNAKKVGLFFEPVRKHLPGVCASLEVFLRFMLMSIMRRDIEHPTDALVSKPFLEAGLVSFRLLRQFLLGQSSIAWQFLLGQSSITSHRAGRKT